MQLLCVRSLVRDSSQPCQKQRQLLTCARFSRHAFLAPNIPCHTVGLNSCHSATITLQSSLSDETSFFFFFPRSVLKHTDAFDFIHGGEEGEIMVARFEQEKAEAGSESDGRAEEKCGRTGGDARVMDERGAPVLTRVWRGRVSKGRVYGDRVHK